MHCLTLIPHQLCFSGGTSNSWGPMLLKASSAPGFAFKILRRLAVLFMPSLPECQHLLAQSYADEALLASPSPTFTKFL